MDPEIKTITDYHQQIAWMGSKEEDQSPEEETRPQPEKEGPSIERPEEQQEEPLRKEYHPRLPRMEDQFY